MPSGFASTGLALGPDQGKDTPLKSILDDDNWRAALPLSRKDCRMHKAFTERAAGFRRMQCAIHWRGRWAGRPGHG
jgi:hypothetical protein